MGNNLASKTPGKSTASDPNHQAIPGKTTLVAGDHPTGHAGIDQGGACVTKTDCLLNPNQREMLVVQYSARVNAALGSFLTALTDLHMETYVKQENQLPWYADLLLGAASGLMVSGIMGVAMHLARGGPAVVEALAEAGAHGVGAAAAQTSIAGLNAKSVESLIKKAVDLGKKGISKTIVGGSVVDNGGEKTSSLNYIDFLRDSAMTTFEHLREDPVGTASDIELVALFEAFEGSRHTPTMYHAKMKAQLERYKASHASEIGRRDGQSKARPEAYGGYKLETRVAWLIEGGGRRLIYVDRAFNHDDADPSIKDPDDTARPGPAYEGQQALSLQDTAEWPSPGGDVSRRRHVNPVGKERMLGYVEEEFVDVALQQQEQMWLATPETFTMNYETSPPTISKVL